MSLSTGWDHKRFPGRSQETVASQFVSLPHEESSRQKIELKGTSAAPSISSSSDSQSVMHSDDLEVHPYVVQIGRDTNQYIHREHECGPEQKSDYQRSEPEGKGRHRRMLIKLWTSAILLLFCFAFPETTDGADLFPAHTVTGAIFPQISLDSDRGVYTREQTSCAGTSSSTWKSIFRSAEPFQSHISGNAVCFARAKQVKMK